MSQKLHIGEGLSLPIDAVTQTFAILGIRGSGKTNTAVVMAEEMIKHGQQCGVLDPTDAWYGLRSSRDGKSEGLKVYVFGGEHGDLPLEGGHGAEMANFLIESGASVVFSLRHLSMNDQRRFAADFGERLRLLKAQPENRNPLHLFLDEAEEFVPQNLRDNDARMFGAFNRMVRRDRNIGLGITLISQRPQSVNKEPLSQIETLVCHRLLHKLDRKSVKESWVEGHDAEGRAEQFFDSLASLEKGDAWVWSPYWLDIFKKVHIRWRETFDSSATPKAGEKPKIAAVRALVDLELLRKKLAASVEKVKENDPAALKRKVAELERQLAKPAKATAAPASTKVDITPKLERAAKAAVKSFAVQVRSQLTESRQKISAAARDFTKLEAELAAATQLCAARATEASAIAEELQNLVSAEFIAFAATLPAPSPEPERRSVGLPPAAVRVPAPPARRIQVTQRREVIAPVNGYSVPHIKILSRLVELLECTGEASVPKEQLAAWAEYSPNSGGFNNYLGTLRSAGAIDYPSGGMVTITEEGRKHAQPDEVPTDSKELLERAKNVLGGSEARILEHVFAQGKEAQISKDELAEAVGLSPNSGGFNNYLGHMRTLGFIDYPQRGMVKCADWMFI